MTVLADSNTTLTHPSERESDDFKLRCIVESMIRDGADEDAIVRTLRAVARSGDAEAGAPGHARSPLRALQRIMRIAA